MKNLKICSENEQIIGNVLEIGDNGIVLIQYDKNEYGTYIPVYKEELDIMDEAKVKAQKDLDARVEKLHEFFPTAEYISQLVFEHMDR